MQKERILIAFIIGVITSLIGFAGGACSGYRAANEHWQTLLYTRKAGYWVIDPQTGERSFFVPVGTAKTTQP